MITETAQETWVSKTERLYDAIKDLATNETIPYVVLNEIAGDSVEQNRSCLYNAIRRLRKEQKRTLDNVPGVGYRVALANEHESLARRHHVKANVQLRKTRELLTSADRNHLTDDERKRYDNLEMTVRSQQTSIRRLEERQDRLEKAHRLVSHRTTKNESKIDTLAQKIAEQEKALKSLKEELKAQSEEG